LSCKFKVEEFDDIKSGYRIKLTFDENPFFENTQIVKEFFLGNAEPTSTTTEIKWKPDNELVNKDLLIKDFPRDDGAEGGLDEEGGSENDENAEDLEEADDAGEEHED
uniref:Uncharacterized protein n=1 Tax=Parascaris equorum TaxID=6256 RepID=A0A914RA60_PAREQ